MFDAKVKERMLGMQEFYKIYSGVMRTFKKRVAVMIDPKPTLDLIHISGAVYYWTNSQAKKLGLTITEDEAKEVIKSYLMS